MQNTKKKKEFWKVIYFIQKMSNKYNWQWLILKNACKFLFYFRIFIIIGLLLFSLILIFYILRTFCIFIRVLRNYRHRIRYTHIYTPLFSIHKMDITIIVQKNGLLCKKKCSTILIQLKHNWSDCPAQLSRENCSFHFDNVKGCYS